MVAIILAPFAHAQTPSKNAMPRFRASDVDAPPNNMPITISPIRLLADENFAPWSFKLEDGTLTGISVELARAACLEAGLTCSLVPLPHSQLLQRLNAGDGEMIVTGLKIDQHIIASAAATKPYFRSMARFLMLKGTELNDVDPRSLAGRRIGVVINTAHHVFLAKHYSRSALVIFESPAELFDALRLKQLDAAFGDAIAMSFWSTSANAQGCCVPLRGALLDEATFSGPLVFVARRDLSNLRDRIDDALDRLESKGASSDIFMRFLPAPIW